MNKVLNEMYYNPETGFQSAPKLFLKLKKEHPQITLKEVSNFINNQETAQITKRTHKPKVFNTIQGYAPKRNFQIDILVYDRYEFNHYKYILMCVDVYSRYLGAVAMTNRKNETIIKALKQIFDNMGVPQSINSDNEFNTIEFKKLMEKHNIQVYFSDPDEINKQAIVERLNRTIASLLQKWRVATGKYDWYKVLPSIISNYNNTVHRTIKNTPSDVFNGLANNEQEIITVEPVFKLGDLVRLKIKKKIFDKGDSLTHSDDIYLIIDKIGNKWQVQNTRTNQELLTLKKAYELTKINEVQYSNKEHTEEKQEHVIIQKDRKIKKAVNKEGIAVNNVALRRSKRERRPNQLEDSRYGKLVY
jgi:hypothetical protein